MKEIILLKDGEIALKGLNRSTFEDKLIKNCRHKLADLGKFNFRKAQSAIYCASDNDEADLEEAFERLSKVFGVAALSRAAVVEKNFDVIKEATCTYLRDALETAKTFKVISKRADKNFPMKSPEICMELGGLLLERFPHLRVDVQNPELLVTVEIREKAAYIHQNQRTGAGGIPVGTGGKAMLLLSGGIDSPVAGYMMAKRGLEIQAIHFVSPPYTSEHAKQKVISLAQKMCDYCGRIRLHIVPFTDIQLAIRDNCPEELFTIIMRRVMMRIAIEVANSQDASALITGESVGQVASQTIQAIACTDAICTIPVMRPVIGMDKEEIITVARKIDTFETSILPYEDCCTVFTPKHPKTKPRLQVVEAAEQALQIEDLIKVAIQTTEQMTCSNQRMPDAGCLRSAMPHAHGLADG